MSFNWEDVYEIGLYTRGGSGRWSLIKDLKAVNFVPKGETRVYFTINHEEMKKNDIPIPQEDASDLVLKPRGNLPQTNPETTISVDQVDPIEVAERVADVLERRGFKERVQQIIQEKPLSLVEASLRCVCGVDTIGGGYHESWCNKEPKKDY